MQSDKRIKTEFEKEVFLFLSGELPEKRIKFWNEYLGQSPELRSILQETEIILTEYKKIPEAEAGDEMLKRAVEVATGKNVISKLLIKFNWLLKKDSNKGYFSIPKLAVGGALIVAAIFFSVISEKPNPVKTIGGELFVWEAESIETSLTEIGSSIFLIKNKEVEEYLKNSILRDPWKNEIYSIDKEINKITNEIDNLEL